MSQKQCIALECGEWLPADAKFCSKCRAPQNGGGGSWRPAIIVAAVLGVVGFGFVFLLQSQLSSRDEKALADVSPATPAEPAAAPLRRETPVVVRNNMLECGPVGLAVRPLVGRNPDRWGPRLGIIQHKGKCYLEARAGAEFGLEFAVFEERPHLFVASIDGTSIMTGQPASADDLGYVIRANAPEDNLVPGWRDGANRVNRFVFSERAMSYASLAGRPQNIGVIGLAAFSPGRTPSQPTPPSPGGAGGAPASDLGTGFGESAANGSRTGRARGGEEVARFALYYASTELLREAGIPVDGTRPLGETDPFPSDSTVPSVPPPPTSSRELYVPANPIASWERFKLREFTEWVGGDLNPLKAVERKDGLWYFAFGDGAKSDWYPMKLLSSESARQLDDNLALGNYRRIDVASASGLPRGAPAAFLPSPLPPPSQPRELYLSEFGLAKHLWRSKDGYLLPFLYLRGIERRGGQWFLDFGNPEEGDGRGFDAAASEWYALDRFADETRKEVEQLISSGRYVRDASGAFDRSRK